MSQRVGALIFGYFFAALTLFYLGTAAWAQWFTDNPGNYKSPEVICLIAMFWSLLAYAGFTYDPEKQNQTKT